MTASKPESKPGRDHDASSPLGGDATRQTGLFGGTFNPIHLGHLRAAEEVRQALRLEKILFIPSATPPHKMDQREDPIAPAELRLQWVEAAVADYPAFSVDRIEIDREGPSFLVDTLKAMRERNGGTPPVFIVGEDAFAEMGEWRAPERLFELADFAVMTRPPGQLRRLEDGIPDIVKSQFKFDAESIRAEHKTGDTRIALVPITALDISSSKIRRACRNEESIRFLVPESVREQILASQCYAPGE
ncbi:MAG: nicotinate-nucleotide adenylyltransferase [Myxococcota bacterium]